MQPCGSVRRFSRCARGMRLCCGAPPFLFSARPASHHGRLRLRRCFRVVAGVQLRGGSLACACAECCDHGRGNGRSFLRHAHVSSARAGNWAGRVVFCSRVHAGVHLLRGVAGSEARRCPRRGACAVCAAADPKHLSLRALLLRSFPALRRLFLPSSPPLPPPQLHERVSLVCSRPDMGCLNWPTVSQLPGSLISCVSVRKTSSSASHDPSSEFSRSF